MSSVTALSRTIVALDNMTKEEVFVFLERAQGKLPFVKIGMELFYHYGRPLVEEVHKKFGVSIFLDLKLHDIPNTVAKAISSLRGLPITFLTLHLTGGEEMVKRALESQKEHLPQTKLLGVSYLTSLGPADFKALWNFSDLDVKSGLINLALMGQKQGLQGMVLSGEDLDHVREIKSLLKVCPGIRFPDEIGTSKIQDQKRVATPEQTLKSGADYLVIGRSLTEATDLSKRIHELSSLQIFKS